jgi:glycosyltransferase involved in cell wall biosynthesis
MRKGHGFELVFAGNRGWLAGDFRDEVATYHRQGFPVSIRLDVTEDELDALYRRARFTLFCSIAEGFGLPIVESLERGVPCIASDLGSMREIAEGGGCLTVDPRSPEAIEAAMISLLTDRELHEKLRSEISRRAFRSWSDCASEMFEFFASPSQ